MRTDSCSTTGAASIPRKLDKAVTQLGVRVLRTPGRAPTANAFCERLGGSLWREGLDFLSLLNEHHLRMIVREWGIHYNRARPHCAFCLLYTSDAADERSSVDL